MQRRALEQADLLHATSEVEYREIREHGFKAPVAIIPNGIDLPDLMFDRPTAPHHTLLFLSRIHPTKGIDRLLQAWRQLQHVHLDWRLQVVGRGEPSHEREVRELAESLQLVRLEFLGPLYGADKSWAYFDADLFVLPTHSENFGMVVAEALAHGCPAVVSQGAPWSGLDGEGCGWWVKHDVPSLIEALDVAMSMPPEVLDAMGKKGRFWMNRDFGWKSVAERMEACYRWRLDGGMRPECVRMC
jgi:glycosyltransferase involved in cell wall biosynthesis